MQAIQYQRENASTDQQQSGKTMELINGTFEANEVREMLFALMNRQINSYKIKNWKSQVNKESADDECMTRMSELNEIKRVLSELCDEAQIRRKDVRIRSHFTLELVEKEH